MNFIAAFFLVYCGNRIRRTESSAINNVFAILLYTNATNAAIESTIFLLNHSFGISEIGGLGNINQYYYVGNVIRFVGAAMFAYMLSPLQQWQITRSSGGDNDEV